jgi:hypothetical protein
VEKSLASDDGKELVSFSVYPATRDPSTRVGMTVEERLQGPVN